MVIRLRAGPLPATLHTKEGCYYLRDIVGSNATGREAFLPYLRRQPPSIRNAIRRLLCSKLAVSVHSRGLFPIILFVFPRCGMLTRLAAVIPGLVCEYVLLFKQNLADHSLAADSLPPLEFHAPPSEPLVSFLRVASAQTHSALQSTLGTPYGPEVRVAERACVHCPSANTGLCPVYHINCEYFHALRHTALTDCCLVVFDSAQCTTSLTRSISAYAFQVQDTSDCFLI